MDYSSTFKPLDHTEALPYNGSHHHLEDIKMDSNFAMLLCSLVFAVAWVIYVTYYNSRLVGYIITKIVNKLFMGNKKFFRIGKQTISCNLGLLLLCILQARLL